MSTQPNDPVLEITTSILSEAAQRPWLAALLMRRKPYWLTRLAQLAQRVRNLPRHTCRTLRRKLASGLAAAALLLALMGAPPTVYAATITVNGDGTGGTCSLYDAVYAANTDAAYGNCPAGSGADIITLTVDVSLPQRLPNIASDITVEGGGYAISGNDLVRVFDVDSGATLTLREATISHGNAIESSGGGVRNYGTVIVQQSTIISNTATNNGGGIVNYGDLTLTNTTLSGNTANTGGGLAVGGNGTTSISGSTFNDNTATGLGSAGGGLALFSSAIVDVQNSTISGNTATRNGEYSGGYGGGMFVNLGDLAIRNSTITNNQVVDGSGSGVYIDPASGAIDVSTTIIAGQVNSLDCDDSGGLIETGGYNIDSDGTCNFIDPTDQWGVASGDLKLLALADNGGPTWTHALDNGSAALEQIPEGANGGCGTTITTDQRGLARPGTKNDQTTKMCEVGAWEAQAEDPTAITLHDLTATTSAAPGVIGAVGALFAALGALLIGRRVKSKARS